MLYFIESYNYLKIEYTQNKTTYLNRISKYRIYNSEFKVLDVVKEGTLEDEKKLHKLLSKYCYYTKWFNKCDEVFKVWKKYTKNMTKFNPEEESNEVIKKSQKEYIITDKLKRIQDDVYKVFGDYCIMTGEEIKNTLREIYSYHNSSRINYVEIKKLTNFGYNLERFLDDHTFKYRISKISS